MTLIASTGRRLSRREGISEERRCPVCGKTFVAFRRDNRFCSPRCASKVPLSRQEAMRRLKRLGLSLTFLRRERRSKALWKIAADVGVSHEWIRQLAKAAGVIERWIPPV